MKRSPAILLLGFLLLSLLESQPLLARTWTAADGRTIEAEFVSATEAAVTVSRAGKKLVIPLDKLSEDDRTFVREKLTEMAATAEKEAKTITGPYAHLVTGEWVLAEHGKLPYAFYGKDLDARQKYPLVISLHGKSDNNENGKQVGQARKFVEAGNYKERPCLVLAPLCYQPHGGTGIGWNRDPGEETIDLIKDLVKNLPLVDPDRVYIIGYSMGGFGTWHLLAKEERLFAAGVPVCGGSNGAASGLRGMPIWCFHGAEDKVVSVSNSRKDAEALKRSKEFKYTEYPGEGHGISGKVVADPELHKWLFEQSR